MHDAPAAGRTGGTTRSPKRARSARGETSSAPGPGTQAGRLAGEKWLRGHRAVGASPLHRQRLPGPNRQETPTGAAVAPPTRSAFSSSAASYTTTACAPPAPTRATTAVQTAQPILFYSIPAHSIFFYSILSQPIPLPPLPAPREKPRPPTPQWRQQSGSCCRSDLRHFRCASGGLARPGSA